MGKKREINLDEVKSLYNKGLSDNEIAKKLNCSRKTIARRRKELGLGINYWKSFVWKDSDTIKQLYTEGKSSAEISKITGVSISTLAKFKKQFNIKSSFDSKMSEDDIKKAMSLAEKGLMDTEIAEMFGVSRSNIWVHRKKQRIESKFSYDKISKINHKEFEDLFNKKLNDREISNILGVSIGSVYSYRMRHGYHRESYAKAKNNPLTQDNIEIILGTMMGDSSMECCNANARMSFAHSPKQKEYRDYKAKKLSNLNPHLYHYVPKPDKRTGKIYESYWCTFPANPAFNNIYNHFYTKGKKRIPFELFDNFTWQSLAYMYMDDGNISHCGGRIATNCFSIDELKKLQIFFKEHFSLDTTILKDFSLYIKAKSFRYMKSKIEPYICECMKYKINQSL